jgi:hypothetical protein
MFISSVLRPYLCKAYLSDDEKRRAFNVLGKINCTMLLRFSSILHSCFFHDSADLLRNIERHNRVKAYILANILSNLKIQDNLHENSGN